MGVATKTMCELGRRCHINGRGLQKFGSMFPQKKVATIASSSVLLVLNGEGGARYLASGTLIAPGVVLCADHTLSTLGPREIVEKMQVLMLYEYASGNAPPGDAFQYRDGDAAWETGKLVESKPQGRVVQVLERGVDHLDYALLAVKWLNTTTSHGYNVVKLPRPVQIPLPSTQLSREVLLVGHPWNGKQQGQATHASAGAVTAMFARDFQGKGNEYSYATISSTYGFSGGGVFNTDGGIVGVLKGVPSQADPKMRSWGSAFLDLGASIRYLDRNYPSRVFRLRNWVKDRGAPFLPSDGVEEVFVL